jgi:hypothetical protein
MKTLITGLFVLISNFLFSQQISCDSISKYSLYEIHDLIVSSELYSKEEITCFGNNLANHDKSLGIKRVLELTGVFTNGCFSCSYFKYGFTTIDFGSNDYNPKNLFLFMDAYNNCMNQLLTKEELLDINNNTSFQKKYFSPYITTLNKFEIKKQTDSTIIFHLFSDTLENLFPENIKYLKVQLGQDISEKDSKEFNYFDLKTKGTLIKLKQKESPLIFITLDFRNMPANYEICWCPFLEKKYRMILPISIK